MGAFPLESRTGYFYGDNIHIMYPSTTSFLEYLVVEQSVKSRLYPVSKVDGLEAGLRNRAIDPSPTPSSPPLAVDHPFHPCGCDYSFALVTEL